jgi:hypothetical protein
VQSAIRGDREAALLWVSKSQRHLVRALADRGYTASQPASGTVSSTSCSRPLLKIGAPSRLSVIRSSSNWIGSTRTRAGLNVHCCLDENKYPKGIKVSDREMASINLKHDSFHREWNYTISPISAKHSSMQPSPSLSKYGPRLAKDD